MQMPPKNRKFRAARKGRSKGNARSSEIHFGDFGMMSTGRSRLNARQIESARRAMTRSLKRGGKIWIRVFPDIPVSKKPLEVRQGKGKGAVDYYAFNVKPGTVVFELSGVEEDAARHAFKLAAAKLPFRVSFIKREVMKDEQTG
jgi:large subunit ribosomal protein L16